MAVSQPASNLPQNLMERLATVLAECQRAWTSLKVCDGEPAAHVHILRKRGKRLRGGLDLLDAPASVREELRDMGRILAPARDAAVRAATFRLLREQPGESYAGDAAIEVAQSLLAEEAAVAEGTPPEPVLEFVANRLRAVTQWLAARPASAADDAIRARLARIAGLTAQRLRRLERADPKPRHYHAARKQVKRLHGAAWFLHPQPGPPHPPGLRELVALGDDLGLLNDLHVLEAWCESAGLTAMRLPGLHRAIKRRRKRLVARIRRRAGKFVMAKFC
jgi:CHAD domain-containing protein